MIRKFWTAAALAVVVVSPSSAQDGADARTLTLAEAVELAARHDPAFLAAEADVARARADRLQARGTFLPSVSANGFYSNSSNERFDQTTGRLVSESYTAQLQGSYDLFAGGRRLLDNRAADRELDAARAVHRSRRFETELVATEAFYAVAAASDLVDVATQRLTRAQQQHEFARTRLELGTATTSDALRAEIEVANAELALHEARSALNVAAFELGRITGLGGAVHAERHSLPDAAPELPPLDELLALADRAAPGVVAAEAIESSARALRFAAMSAYLPTLRLTAGYDWFSFEFPPDQESWSMRLFASVPIFNGFQREAAVQRAAATEDLAQAQARDARLAARAEVQAAAAEVELAEQRVAISTRTVALAEEDLRVQEERYRIGAATILDLQASQLALAEAQISNVRSKQSLGGAVARLEAILGENLDG
ncbi:MAG TPA: TolC family protein [Longimicrobiales bacterium]